MLRLLLLAAVLSPPAPTPSPDPLEPPTVPTPVPERMVAAAVADVRAGELLLDADALSQEIAASFTLVEDGARVAGAFAFLEPMRRLRASGAKVTALTHDELAIQVYGGSAVASYAFTRSWREGRTRHTRRGWITDVFELRDDGKWILVHRHVCHSP